MKSTEIAEYIDRDIPETLFEIDGDKVDELLVDIIHAYYKVYGSYPKYNEFRNVLKSLGLTSMVKDYTQTSYTSLKKEAGWSTYKAYRREEGSGWVYVLKCTRIEDNKVFYRVGITVNTPIDDRINIHKNAKGGFSAPIVKHGKEILGKSEETKGKFDIEVVTKKRIEQPDGMTDDEFKRYMLMQEQKAASMVAIQKGTDKVVGR